MQDVTAPVVCDQPDHVSQADVDAKVKTELELVRIGWTHGWTITVQKNTLTALRSLVSEGTLTRFEAVETYNAIALANGWAEVENIIATYTVEVTYNGDVVLTVEGVEADDDDQACNEVLENVDIDNVRLNFDISYGDYSDSADVYIYDFDPSDLSAIATEEE